MAGRTNFDNAKFKELVLLLSERSKNDRRMSRVKLNKLLYRADFEAYRKLGRSMTGATYKKGEFGPMAAELPGAEKELGRRGYLTWKGEKAGGHPQKVPVALEPADRSMFSGEELGIIEAVLLELLPYGGKAASDWSHEESAGWNLVGDDQPIPYETAFVSTERPDDSLFRRAKRLARERDWDKVRP
jgi:hypothetical protein